MDADVVVVGAGLAGLAATAELADAGQRVLLLDQEPRADPRRAGVLVVRRAVPRRHPGAAPAWASRTRSSWPGRTGWAAPSSTAHEDHWPRRWAEAYVEFAAGREARLAARARASGSSRWSAGPSAATAAPTGTATRCPASTSPGAPAPAWWRRSSAGSASGACERPGHASASGTGSTSWSSTRRRRHRRARGGPASRRRGRARQASSRERDRRLRARRAGRDRHLRRHRRQPRPGAPALARDRLGAPPERMVAGVPAHVDGRMLEITERRRRPDHQPRPDVALHRGRAQLGPDLGRPRHPDPARTVVAVARRRRASACRRRTSPASTRSAPCARSCEHRLRPLAGSCSPRRSSRRSSRCPARSRTPTSPARTSGCLSPGAGRARPAPVEAFKQHGADFVVADTLDELVAGMNALTDAAAASTRTGCARQIEARDRQLDNPFSKDAQVTAIRGARRYRGDRLVRTATPHRILDPAAGPLIAVRLHILTRKTLGGLQTDLDGRVLQRRRASRCPGLYAAGEVGRLRRRRHARLQRARGHLPRRLPLLRTQRRPRRRRALA